MQKINYVLQAILRIFLIFLFIFIWVKFFFKSFWPSILLSVFFAIFIDLLIKIFTKKNQKVKQLKLKEKEECENMFLSLATNSCHIDFFYKLAKTKHTALKNKNYIRVKHDDGDVILYPFLNFCSLQLNDLNQIIKSIKEKNFKKIVVCAGEISKESFIFVKNFEFEIVLLDKFETYKQLYKNYNFFPEITLTYKKDKKATFKEILAYSFNRKKTKSYIFSAFVLLFSSLFVPASLYYCIISSLLVVFAIISFFNPFCKESGNLFEL